MFHETDPQRIIRTLTGQLESDLFLGGRWLPIGRVETVQTPTRPTGITRATKMTTAPKNVRETPQLSNAQIKIIEEKRQRLTEIAEKVTQCRLCQLHSQRHNSVAGEGNPDARLVFVGEAPGQTEDEQGRPFVGRAGKLLTNIIDAMGLKREDVFIGNILKCRPPNNRDPQASEIAECINFLYEQLEIIEPEIIVALGAHAAHTLLNTNTPIGQLRGRFHEYLPHPFAKPIKLMATYHPAYLLRNYSKDNRLRVWQDMQKVLQELKLPIPGK
ncbi:MAG: uracil-DNA glycosylase [Sedimentisphaerales bacterium]|nr:uracil-DNA glycosylase [Sedimentisphaerales bacterium]